MAQSSRFRPTDHDIEQLLGQLLRYGVLTAGTVALAGALWYLSRHGGDPVPDYHGFQGVTDSHSYFSSILQGVRAGDAASIIQTGVVLLIATPILRIVFSLLAFVMERDKLYVLITLIVLAIISTSIFGGLKV